MPDIDGVDVTQIGEDDNTGLNVLNHLYVAGVEITPGTADGSTLIIVNEAAHGLSDGNVLYRASGSWELAQADDATTSSVKGVVKTVDADQYLIVTSGLITLSGLTDGADYYLSDSVAGGVTTTPPTSPNYVAPVYSAISTTQAIVNIQLSQVGA